MILELVLPPGASELTVNAIFIFDDCCDLLRQHSTVIFTNVFNLHILVITRALKINYMDSRQDSHIISGFPEI